MNTVKYVMPNVSQSNASFAQPSPLHTLEKDQATMRNELSQADASLAQKDSEKAQLVQELNQARQTEAALTQKVRELEQHVDRLKYECQRHINHYKQKYTEYKAKMKKANQNIAVLMARIARFDLQMAAEKEDQPRVQQKEPRGGSPPGWAGDQLQDLLSNDGLNEEIRKLLAENINY